MVKYDETRNNYFIYGIVCVTNLSILVILKDLIINLIVNLIVLYIYFNGYDTNKD